MDDHFGVGEAPNPLVHGSPKVPMLRYVQYCHAHEDRYLPEIRALISRDLSEPYSIYVYRFFLCQWSRLSFMVNFARAILELFTKVGICAYKHVDQALSSTDDSLIGIVICKLEVHSTRSPPTLRGYIAMLAVAEAYRGRGIATALVRLALDGMIGRCADEVVLETEESNLPAMRLYERLGFLRAKKLHRYYLNGNSAFRLVLPLRPFDKDALLRDLDARMSLLNRADDNVPTSPSCEVDVEIMALAGAD